MFWMGSSVGFVSVLLMDGELLEGFVYLSLPRDEVYLLG